jgi:RimJ/RimL family protein N-acetyltransferase
VNLTTDLELLGPWAWKRMGPGEWHPQGKTALGELDDDGDIKWAVVYDDYELDGSIYIHTAITSPKYVTRRALQAVFEYPFHQLGVKKVLAKINSENHKSLTFNMRLGFQVEAIIEDAYDVGNMYILSLTPERCQWIRGKDYGWISKRTEAA